VQDQSDLLMDPSGHFQSSAAVPYNGARLKRYKFQDNTSTYYLVLVD